MALQRQRTKMEKCRNNTTTTTIYIIMLKNHWLTANVYLACMLQGWVEISTETSSFIPLLFCLLLVKQDSKSTRGTCHPTLVQCHVLTHSCLCKYILAAVSPCLSTADGYVASHSTCTLALSHTFNPAPAPWEPPVLLLSLTAPQLGRELPFSPHFSDGKWQRGLFSLLLVSLTAHTCKHIEKSSFSDAALQVRWIVCFLSWYSLCLTGR